MFNCMETSDDLNCVRQVVVCDTVKDCPSGFDESSCSCDDYPFDFCPTGECFLDNETMKPVCMYEFSFNYSRAIFIIKVFV